MSVSEFNESTMDETITWIDARAKARSQSERYTGEMLRWLGSILANVFGGKKRIRPKDLFKFPDEETGDIQYVGGKMELSQQQKDLFEKMRIAALKYQHGNNRERNNQDRGESQPITS